MPTRWSWWIFTAPTRIRPLQPRDSEPYITTKVHAGIFNGPASTTTITMINENDAPVTTAASVAMPTGAEDVTPVNPAQRRFLFGRP